ncbi:MAG TPA: hypothetical protein VMS55_05275 [Myxococcota bacterium]|nr:hypothetical protein [Myxococcota bacterium]
MTRRLAVLLAAALLGASPMLADDHAPPAASAPDAARPTGAAARDALQRARAAVSDAQVRLDQANAAYSLMRAKNYPKGAEREKIAQERTDAQRAYDAAKAHYDEVAEQTGGE